MSYRLRLTVVAVTLMAGVFASPAFGQMSRVGPTFTVNRLSNGNTTPVRYTDVAWDSVNNVYLVVWGAFGEILGRFVMPDGTVLGTDPFVITAPGSPSDYKDAPRMAFSPDTASFMVIWRDNRTDSVQPTLWGRSLSYAGPSGIPSFVGADFLVTAAFVNIKDSPAITYSTGSREFFVVYNRDWDVRGRRYLYDGTLISSEIMLGATGDYEGQPNVAYNPNNNEYLAVWWFYSDPLAAGTIRASRVRAGTDQVLDAVPLSLDVDSALDVAVPSAAFDPVSGRYLVVWYKFTGIYTIAARMVNADGSVSGGRFTAATTGNYVDLDVDYSTRTGTYFAAFAHHDIIDIFGVGISAAGAPDPMVQVTVSAAVTGTDYGRTAASTLADEWLVTSNIWWNKAIAQRMTSGGGSVGAFSKQAPGNAASGLGTDVTLSWDPVPGATYEVCIDQTLNSACDTSWQPTSTASIVRTLPGGTHSWQVRSVVGGVTTQANAGVWWSFFVGTAPVSFAKISPLNGSSGVSSPVTLSWLTVGAATYEYCVDTTNNNACDGAWQSSSTSTVAPPLAPGTYFWQVRLLGTGAPLDADGGTWWSFTVAASPPPGGGNFGKLAPANGATGLSSDVTLQWAAVTDAGYSVCWDTINNNACDGTWWPNGGGTSRLLSGLGNGTYYWQVRAQTSAGVSEADGGAWANFTVGVSAPPPPPPGGANFGKLAPANGATGSASDATLQWAAVPDAGYSVCWDTINNNACDGAWWPNGGGTSRLLSGLGNGTYYWQVRAQTSAGVSDADGGAWASFTVGASAPPPGGGNFGKLAPANGATGLSSDVTLQWAAVPNAGYSVCWDTINNNACDGTWWPNGGGTSRLLSGLGNGTYYWQVRAQTSAGVSDADGGAWANFTVGASAPPPGGVNFGKLAPANGATGLSSDVTLQWAAVPNAGYSVCWDTINNNACDGTWWPNGGGASRLLSGLGNGTYYWQVRAQTSAGVSDADGGAWANFTVGASAPPPGGVNFGKLAPGNGATGLSSTVGLQWGSAGDAGYWVCWDTINNNACDGTWWPNGGGTSRLLSGLAVGTYYWQVRAQTSAGVSDADGGAWASFTVTSSEPEALLTIAATLMSPESPVRQGGPRTSGISWEFLPPAIGPDPQRASRLRRFRSAVHG